MTLFQWVFAPTCTLVAVWFLIRALQGNGSRPQALLWTLIWGSAGWLIFRPSSLSAISARLGVGRGADLISYLAILAGLSACVYFYNRYRHLEILITAAIRQQAIEQAQQGSGHPACHANSPPTASEQ